MTPRGQPLGITLYLSEMLQGDLGVKRCFDVGGKHVPLHSVLWICDYKFFFYFLFSGPEAFSAACPILLLTFETLVRLSWLKKDLSFQICDGCQPESCYTTVCNCTLSTGVGCDSETTAF